MRLDEMYYTEIEMEGMKEILRDKEEEIKKLKEKYDGLWKIYISESNELKEENKKLKKENFVMKDRLKFGYKGVTREEIERVEEENQKLKVIIENNDLEQKADWKHIEELEQENKKLKEDLAFKNTMLDNVSAEYKSSQNVIKKLEHERDMHRDAAKDCGYDIKDLQERIRFLEQCLDNKEKVNKSLREENKRLSDFLECES